jgi:hypothetical protein
MPKKLTYDQVYKVFKDGGCELLEKEYINSRTKLKYKCSCGNKSEILWHNFKKGHRCNKCGNNQTAEKQKLTFKFIYGYFKEQRCELLEKEYKNNSIKMKYRCSCGNISKIKFSHFKDGCRCKKCGLEKRKFSFEFIKKYFEEHGCKLLEKKYINCEDKMKYICSCGNTSKITFYSFRQGHRCKKCGLEKISGKNNYNYNYNLTDKERELNKSRCSDPCYVEWRTNIYKKDDYTCHKCSQRGGILNAHHIKNYATNQKIRLDISNGMTFCIDCHKKFHKKYGKIGNNQIQISEFLKKVI